MLYFTEYMRCESIVICLPLSSGTSEGAALYRTYCGEPSECRLFRTMGAACPDLPAVDTGGGSATSAKANIHPTYFERGGG